MYSLRIYSITFYIPIDMYHNNICSVLKIIKNIWFWSLMANVCLYETISTNIWWYLCLKINWSLYKNILFILIIFMYMFLHCYHISIGRNRNLWSSSVVSVVLGLFGFDPLYVILDRIGVEYVHWSNGSNNGSQPVYHHMFDKCVPRTTIF